MGDLQPAMIREVDRRGTNKQTKAAKISLSLLPSTETERRVDRSRDSRNTAGEGKDGEREKVP